MSLLQVDLLLCQDGMMFKWGWATIMSMHDN